MPVTKRTSKVTSYKEEDDDDDFVPLNDKNRSNKSNTVMKESKPSKAVTKQPVEKHEEKIVDQPKLEEIESKEPVVQLIIEDNEKENSDSQSSVSSHGNDNQEESLSPKPKRVKPDEAESVDTNISHNHTTRLSDLPKRNSSVPIGFPTDKINIPSPHISRVGLSRKSATIKPLHPNFVARIESE